MKKSQLWKNIFLGVTLLVSLYGFILFGATCYPNGCGSKVIEVIMMLIFPLYLIYFLVSRKKK
jgi:hypothetical protein